MLQARAGDGDWQDRGAAGGPLHRTTSVCAIARRQAIAVTGMSLYAGHAFDDLAYLDHAMRGIMCRSLKSRGRPCRY